jgi:hypothetical protein
MISQKLVHLIEDHARELSGRWLKDVRQHADTFTYHHFPEDKLRERAFDVYSQLNHWIQSEDSRQHVEQIYRALGAERYREGFRLSEVVKALILTKRHLWFFILEQGLFDSVTELYQVLELYNSVILFFDRAVHFTVVGFETEAGLHRSVSD